MNKRYSIVNGAAYGILERNGQQIMEELEFNPEGKKSVQDMRELLNRNKGAYDTRSQGRGFGGRADIEQMENDAKNDFEIIGDQAFYTGDVRETNSLLNTANDIETLNVRVGVVVNVGDSNVVSAQVDRLLIGDREKYNKFTLATVQRGTHGAFKIVNKGSKSYEQIFSIPLGSLDILEAESKMDEIFQTTQALRDKLMTDVEKSEIGQQPIFKTMAKFLHTKDVARTMIEKLNKDISREDINAIIDILFAQNNLGPMSTMSITLSFTVTKVVRTNNPANYPGYTQYDPASQALRSFVNRYDVKIPINPAVLVSNGELIESYKSYVINNMLYIYNSALDEQDSVKWKNPPAIVVEKHNLAGITKEEFEEFQQNVLPEEVMKAMETYRENEKIRLASKTLNEYKDPSEYE